MPTTNPVFDIQDDLMDVYLRQWKTLRNILKKRTGSHDLADDALQETWLRLSGMKGREVPIFDSQAFILRVAGNIAKDLLRKRQLDSARCVSDDEVLNALVDAYPSPEAFVIDRDQLRFLTRALLRLPAKPRAALLLSRCDQLTHAEIAVRLRGSESMVARYLAQALRHCRDHFRAAE